VSKIMTKFFVLGLAALGVALVSEQQAQAWINSKFAVGLNWNWQSGGNNLLWGAFRNGQPQTHEGPGPFQFAPPPHHHGGGFPSHFPAYGPGEFQYFGQQHQAPGHPGTAAGPNMTPPPPTAAAVQQQQAYHNPAPAYYGQQNPYQPVNYSPSMYGYPTSGYSYPGYYGYTVAPTYWYGR
jgi:hypothetical protein